MCGANVIVRFDEMVARKEASFDALNDGIDHCTYVVETNTYSTVLTRLSAHPRQQVGL